MKVGLAIISFRLLACIFTERSMSTSRRRNIYYSVLFPYALIYRFLLTKFASSYLLSPLVLFIYFMIFQNSSRITINTRQFAIQYCKTKVLDPPADHIKFVFFYPITLHFGWKNRFEYLLSSSGLFSSSLFSIKN